MVRKILLSGSSGFVGQNLINYFSQNNNPIDFNFVKRESSNSEQSISWNSLSELIEMDIYCIIHLAGKAHDLKNVSSPEDYTLINHDLTVKLFEVFLKSKASKFIFISSVKASADSVNTVLTEELNPAPLTAYGKSKLQAEVSIQKMLYKHNIENPEIEKKLYILRPCMIHGPGNKGNLNLLFKLVITGIPWPLGSFENKRSFLSIENLCFVIREIIEKEIEPGVYQVADDEPLSTKELINLMAITLNRKNWIVQIPKSLIVGFARIGDVLRLPLNSERLKKLTESYVVSNSKLVKALGHPLPINTKDGLSKTIQSFKK
jgi:nucleoside-diphosphate-sugar epimerase